MTERKHLADRLPNMSRWLTRTGKRSGLGLTVGGSSRKDTGAVPAATSAEIRADIQTPKRKT